MDSVQEIILHIHKINELLNSPGAVFRKRTLNSDTEEFIVEEAEGLSRSSIFKMIIHLKISEEKYKEEIAPAIHRHFCYRKEQSQKIFKRTLNYGWRNLMIAIVLLGVIYTILEISIHIAPNNGVVKFIRESFVILGWVVVWRPMELLLYDWYPIKRDIKIFSKLEKCSIQIVIHE